MVCIVKILSHSGACHYACLCVDLAKNLGVCLRVEQGEAEGWGR